MSTRLLALCLFPLLTLPLAAQQGNMSSPFQVHGSTASPSARTAHHSPNLPQPTYTTLPEGQVADRYDHFSFDIHGFYAFRAAAHSVYATDMKGVEAEFAWYLTPRQAFTLGASFGTGGSDTANYVDTPQGRLAVSEDFSRTDVSVMLGYRYTQPLTQRTRLSFGLKAGLDVQNLSYDDVQAERADEGYWEWNDFSGSYEQKKSSHRYSKTRCGLGYAASVTLETKLTERMLLLLGYQYRGATTEPQAPSIVPGGPGVSARSLRWHEIHLGLRFEY